ncbi:MAG: DUF3737 family protein [Bifidobacteriaceae bacterium]|nr:DUF3737 family protein [Bifidobacteriaceae bacterium]
MKTYTNDYYTGERSLFAEKNALVSEVTFGEGESPLKEGRNLSVEKSIFQWKYPLWYCSHVNVDSTIFETMARSGIWYTKHLTMEHSSVQAPKMFRRCSDIALDDVHFSDAAETLWNCDNVKLTNVRVHGDYFGMQSSDVYADHIEVIGNYVFDGAHNVEVHHSTFVSKDAFWNCENVALYDCVIDGEYLAWNTKNLTLVNCTVESNQGLCYVDGLTIRHGRLLHTDLAFEFSRDIDAQIDSTVMSVKNPISGTIAATGIDDVILDPDMVDPSATRIEIVAPERTDAEVHCECR